MNRVVCPIPKLDGVGNPCVKPMIFPYPSYRCKIALTLLIGLEAAKMAEPILNIAPLFERTMPFVDEHFIAYLINTYGNHRVSIYGE